MHAFVFFWQALLIRLSKKACWSQGGGERGEGGGDDVWHCRSHCCPLCPPHQLQVDNHDFNQLDHHQGHPHQLQKSSMMTRPSHWLFPLLPTPWPACLLWVLRISSSQDHEICCQRLSVDSKVNVLLFPILPFFLSSMIFISINICDVSCKLFSNKCTCLGW